MARDYMSNRIPTSFVSLVKGMDKKKADDVMLSEEKLLESGLSRILKKYQEYSCGAITGFRGSRTRAENRSINKKILSYLLNKGYSVTKVKGAYVENFGSKDSKEVGEESFFVCNHRVAGDDNGQLESDLLALGKMYDQDSVLVIKPGSDGVLVGTSRRDNAWPSYGEKVSVGRMKLGSAAGQFFSRIKGRQFAFESITEMEMPETINGLRVMMMMAEEVEKSLNK